MQLFSEERELADTNEGMKAMLCSFSLYGLILICDEILCLPNVRLTGL